LLQTDFAKDKTMNALNAPARKVRVTAQQVAFLTLTEGVGKVIAMHNAPGSQIASATFDSAVDLLASQPTAQAALLEIRSDLFGDDEPGARGRPAAKVGDSRSYKVQQVGDMDPFVRLPVSLLGISKGQTATVTFENGRIVVRV
jgi:hypothetical protein